MNRTHNNGELTIKNVGEKVELVGWVAKRRNLGKLLFIDLRDRTGIVQLLIKEGVEVPDVRNEYVIHVTGTVCKKDVPNNNMTTFVLLNTASIQIIPTSMIALRAMYGASNPSSIVVPVLIVTTISLIFGLTSIKILNRFM